MKPKLDVAILRVPARVNLDGYFYQGSNAHLVLESAMAATEEGRKLSKYTNVGYFLFAGSSSY